MRTREDMGYNESNVKMTMYWTIIIAVIAVSMSLIWANTVNHDNDDKVKIAQVQEKK